MYDSFERIAPTNTRQRYKCNSCGHLTIHLLEAECRAHWSGGDDVSGGAKFQTFRCGGCDDVIYVTSEWNNSHWDVDDEGNTYAIVTQKIYPVPETIHLTLQDIDYAPLDLQRLIGESLAAYEGNHTILATVGLRFIIEYICKDQRCVGRNLEKKIDSLHTIGLIDEEQRDLFQEIRKRGNAGAHSAVPMSPPELQSGFDIIGLIVDKVYTQPIRAKEITHKARKALTKAIPPEVSRETELAVGGL